MSTTDDASQSVPSTVGTEGEPLTADEKRELMTLVKTPDLTSAQIARAIDLSRRHAASRLR
ncbi:hypothetical protein [Nocardia sp. alder85J]|uniref:hypothetical protein n=1 Tax=Nocardia sp. alder85J TaxID=2862949 RepID=UPI001CD4B447|nr:hypothetical protein [Nocardia sp. alder85J]MCX4094546.1 hypothetical protein [Nocardia sp. alder85J]